MSNLNGMSFNNSEEDEEIIREEKNNTSNMSRVVRNSNKNNKKNNTPMIIMAVLVLIIIILLVALLIKDGSSSEEKNSDNNNSNSSENSNNGSKENDNKDTNNDKNPEKKYDINDKDSLLIQNKYVLINDDKKAVLLDLDGDLVDSFNREENEKIDYFTYNKELYFIKSGSSKNIVYKLYKNKLNEQFTLEGSSIGFIKDENNNIIGLYDSYSEKEVLYLLNKDSYDKVAINNYLVGSSSSESKDKNVYNGKYIITIKSNLFGIYDIKNDKELIEPKYKKIEYLTKDYFAASKDDDFGIIDKDDKTLLDFKYDSIKYSNDLYFAINDKGLSVLNSNYKEIASADNINNSTNRIQTAVFGDNVIYLANRAIAVDKNGRAQNLDFDNFYVYGSYLVTSKSNSTIVTLYDKSLKVYGEYDTKTKDNNVYNTAIFLNSVLVLNGGQCFALNTRQSKGNINLYRRTSQDYLVTYERNKDGKITIFYNDQELGSVTGVNLMDFLNSDNNGISVTKDYFIYSAGNVHYITKNVKEK